MLQQGEVSHSGGEKKIKSTKKSTNRKEKKSHLKTSKLLAYGRKFSFTLSNMLIKIRQNKDIFKDAKIHKNINCYKMS